MSTLTLEGLRTPGPPEDRAIVHLKVEHNGNTYDWQAFVPKDVNLQDFLVEVQSKIESEIDAKEAAWAALTPKTRTVEDPFTGTTTVVDIQKEEVVRPDMPDYYALRRAEYPPLSDQLDAFWKGPESPDYAAMLAKIQAVKNKYPKQ